MKTLTEQIRRQLETETELLQTGALRDVPEGDLTGKLECYRSAMRVPRV
jgi:hypothetical protein